MTGPQTNMLPDGRRLHLNHGPIDLIIEAFGAAHEVKAAYQQATARFQTILPELVEELPALRRAASSRPRRFAGVTARRMEAAVSPLAAENFITPMAAVAGSVADEILAALVKGRTLYWAYVNNGGDSALFLASGQSLRLAIGGTSNGFADRIAIHAKDAVRGVATSGWRGRSFSLGIADAVTVLARTAAQADAAATIIANAVDLPGHAAIRREKANKLAPDSDLGERLVTTGVGALSEDEAAEALEAGLASADSLLQQGLIEAAALFLNGVSRVSGVLRYEPASLRAPLWPAGHLPHTGGEQPASRLSPIFNSDAAHDAPTASQPISPHVGEMAGRPEGGNVERRLLGRSPNHGRPYA